jgi:MoaA/NifB/PqqE/SkfB family radical SAM enzyme
MVPWLYDTLRNLSCESEEYKFHLNTNCYEWPPVSAIKRLKVSLDSHSEAYWNNLVGKKDAFERVTRHIAEVSRLTVTSVTCTLTHENIHYVLDYTNWLRELVPHLYAIFFSIYKGTNPRFQITENDAKVFFGYYLRELNKILDEESVALLAETLSEKHRLMEGIRFPENKPGDICWLSTTERVIAPDGEEYTCSHLYRDGIKMKQSIKHEKCRYGCNRRLVAFNTYIEERIEGYVD